jgi:hypothetical protein
LIQQSLLPSSHFANRLADADHPLLRGNRTQVRAPCLRRIAPTKRVPQKVEFLFRQFADRVFVSFTVNFSFVMMSRILASASSARPRQQITRSISVVNDVCSKTLLVSELLPSPHESTHVQVAEHRADRGSLRSSSSLIPIARAPMLIPFLVGLFNRSF